MTEQPEESGIPEEEGTKDFDLAWKERAELKPLRVKLKGSWFDLPATMPAAAVVKTARYMVEGRQQDDLTAAEVLDMAADVFPKPILQALFDLGITTEELGEVTLWAITQYMDREKKIREAAAAADSLGEAEAPQTSGAK